MHVVNKVRCFFVASNVFFSIAKKGRHFFSSLKNMKINQNGEVSIDFRWKKIGVQHISVFLDPVFSMKE